VSLNRHEGSFCSGLALPAAGLFLRMAWTRRFKRARSRQVVYRTWAKRLKGHGRRLWHRLCAPYDVVARAIDMGVNYFDTSAITATAKRSSPK